MSSIRQFALIVSLSLAGCITAPSIHDSAAAALTDAILAEADRYYTDLATRAAPQCDYEHNMNTYAQLQNTAGQLNARLADSHASAALLRAGDALSRTIEGTRASHQLASAKTDDVHGACMAPGALALNADAISRAGQAIAHTLHSEGSE